MYKIILLILGLVILVGCTPEPQLQQCPGCYCNCPSCGDEIYIYFELADNIQLFNDYGLLTDKELVKPYYIDGFEIKIHNGATPQNATLCVEHKFDEVDIEDLYEVPVPEETITRIDYRIDCWSLPEMQRYDILRYNIQFYHSGDEEEQTVKVWLE